MHSSIKLKESLASKWQENTCAQTKEWAELKYFEKYSNPHKLLQPGLRDKLSLGSAGEKPEGCFLPTLPYGVIRNVTIPA